MGGLFGGRKKLGGRRVHFVAREEAARLPSHGERFVSLFREPKMRAVLYEPRGHDPQTPHKDDEVYVVVAGTGKLRVDDQVFSFGVGDLLYVPAGVEHRFEDFTDDFSVWAIFAR